MELVTPLPDRAEPLLTDATCRFVLPLPSATVRRHIEAERERRSLAPLDPREREDAPPHLLRDAWLEVVEYASQSGMKPDVAPGSDYDPALYNAVYSHLLRHRRLEVLPLDVLLPTESFSPYLFEVAHNDLTPSPEEAAFFIGKAERLGPLSDRLTTDY
jgi:hypothetical protein